MADCSPVGAPETTSNRSRSSTLNGINAMDKDEVVVVVVVVVKDLKVVGCRLWKQECGTGILAKEESGLLPL